MCPFNAKSSSTYSTQESRAWKTFEAGIAALKVRESGGYFDEHSITWKIYREPALLFGGVSTLLLQLAHPSVAKGVFLHSNFQKEYLYRAHRTFDTMAGFYFGTAETAQKNARHLFALHGTIKGQIGKIEDGFWKLEPFRARDPDLLIWVLATLIYSSISVYELLLDDLSLSEKEQFFEESKTLAVLMGIPLDLYPKNYHQFCNYFDEQLAGATLKVTPINMELARVILKPPLRMHRIFRKLAPLLLPKNLQREYQLMPSPSEKIEIQKMCKRLRFILKILPKSLRYAPPYFQAKARCPRQPAMSLGKAYNLLAKKFTLPFLLKTS